MPVLLRGGPYIQGATTNMTITGFINHNFWHKITVLTYKNTTSIPITYQTDDLNNHRNKEEIIQSILFCFQQEFKELEGHQGVLLEYLREVILPDQKFAKLKIRRYFHSDREENKQCVGFNLIYLRHPQIINGKNIQLIGGIGAVKEDFRFKVNTKKFVSQQTFYFALIGLIHWRKTYYYTLARSINTYRNFAKHYLHVYPRVSRKADPNLKALYDALSEQSPPGQSHQSLKSKHFF